MAYDDDSYAHSKLIAVLLGILFSLTLAVTLFAAGFAACAIQPTTRLLSTLFSDFGTSVYLPNNTVEIAVATRDFTVKPYAQGESAAADELARVILQAAEASSAPGSPKASAWGNSSQGQTGSSSSSPAAHLGQTVDQAPSADLPSEERVLSLDLRKESDVESTVSSATGSDTTAHTVSGEYVTGMYALAQRGSSYAYGSNEISHLIDCNRLINTAVPVLIVIAIVALASGIALRTLGGSHAFGMALAAAPAVLLCAMVGLGVWAAVDFSGFFGAFHALLFPQGNWTFPYDSLLICTLPTPFWIGMATIWVVVTIGLSLVSVIVGRRIMGR